MDFQEQLTKVIQHYGAGSLDETRYLLASLRPPELANLLESTPPKVRWVLWGLLDEEEENQVLQHLHEDVLAEFVESMKPAQLVGKQRETLSGPLPIAWPWRRPGILARNGYC